MFDREAETVMKVYFWGCIVGAFVLGASLAIIIWR